MISPSPSMFFGRDSSRSTCRWLSWSSAASSIVTIRSLSGTAADSAFRNVVLPEPVPPEMRMFSCASMQFSRNSAASFESVPMSISSDRCEAVLRELPDRQQRTRERERRDDRVHARPVGQARVDQRRRLVDPPPDLADHLRDDPAQVRRVGERQRRLREQAVALDPDVLRAVDHDLRDRRIGEQPLERAVAEDVVGDLGRETLPVVAREPRLLRELVADLGLDALANSAAVLDVEEPRPELADEREMDPVLQLGERVGPAAVAVTVRGHDRRAAASSRCARAVPLPARLPQQQPPPPVVVGERPPGSSRDRQIALGERCVRPGRLRLRLGHDDRLPARERTRNRAVAADQDVGRAAEQLLDVELA